MWIAALIVMLGACDEFKSANIGTGSEGDGSSSSGDESTTLPPTTDGGTTAATDSAGNTTTADGPTTGDASDSTPTSDGETTADPTMDPTTTGTMETTSDPGSSSSSGAPASDSDPTTGPMICEQQDTEPNDLDNADEFVDLGSIGCGPTQYDFAGTIEDGNDEDWLGYGGAWDCGATNDPQVFIDVTGNNVEVCVSPACVVNTTAYYTCAEGTNWTVDGGDYGCCSTDVVRMNVNCGATTNESLVASIRVRSGDAVCEDYALSYAYLVQ